MCTVGHLPLLAEFPANSRQSGWQGTSSCCVTTILTWKYDRAEKGNVFQVAKLGSRGAVIRWRSGFGASAAAAIDVNEEVSWAEILRSKR